MPNVAVRATDLVGERVQVTIKRSPEGVKEMQEQIRRCPEAPPQNELWARFGQFGRVRAVYHTKTGVECTVMMETDFALCTFVVDHLTIAPELGHA